MTLQVTLGCLVNPIPRESRTGPKTHGKGTRKLNQLIGEKQVRANLMPVLENREEEI